MLSKYSHQTADSYVETYKIFCWLFRQDLMTLTATQLQLRSHVGHLSTARGHTAGHSPTDHGGQSPTVFGGQFPTIFGGQEGGGEHTEVAFVTFLLTLFSAINLLLGKKHMFLPCFHFKIQVQRINIRLFLKQNFEVLV